MPLIIARASRRPGFETSVVQPLIALGAMTWNPRPLTGAPSAWMLIMASAFSAIIVYAQDLLPGRVGLVGGLFFGVSFGLGGLGAAALGKIADLTSIDTVYQVCAFLPLFGLLIALLPKIESKRLA